MNREYLPPSLRSVESYVRVHARTPPRLACYSGADPRNDFSARERRKVRRCTTLRRSPCIPFRINYRYTYTYTSSPVCERATEGTCRRRRRRRSATSRARPTRRKLASVTNVTRTRMEKLRLGTFIHYYSLLTLL